MFESEASLLYRREVAVSAGHGGYPGRPPYSPSTVYPEYPFDPPCPEKGANEAYEGVREALRLLGLDVARYGRKDWDPLCALVRPGNTVVLKPNFVRNFRETLTGHENCLITHGSIIRGVIDYTYMALQGRGRIIIADAPQNDADFSAIRRMAGLDEIRDFYRDEASFDIEVLDLRPEKTRKVNGVICGHEQLSGDPAGYVKVDLGGHSMFAEVDHLCHLLYGSEYDTSEVRKHHTDGVHEYLISKTVLDADCIINLPKLKTHKKTGMTVCMKNLVGINGNKNWLPHHRLGTPSQGGDQFADDSLKHRIERKAMEYFRKFFPLLGPVRRFVAKPLKAVGRNVFGNTDTDTIRSGNWYGNDTTWRMVHDLNRILMYADQNGGLEDRPARNIFNIVDGIIGGEGNGPLDTTPKASGLVIAGMNSVAVDLACARLMGYDYKRIPLLCRALDNHFLPFTKFGYDEAVSRSNISQYDKPLAQFNGGCSSFNPHFGWQGDIEVDSAKPETKST